MKDNFNIYFVQFTGPDQKTHGFWIFALSEEDAERYSRVIIEDEYNFDPKNYEIVRIEHDPDQKNHSPTVKIYE